MKRKQEILICFPEKTALRTKKKHETSLCGIILLGEIFFPLARRVLIHFRPFYVYFFSGERSQKIRVDCRITDLSKPEGCSGETAFFFQKSISLLYFTSSTDNFNLSLTSLLNQSLRQIYSIRKISESFNMFPVHFGLAIKLRKRVRTVSITNRP